MKQTKYLLEVDWDNKTDKPIFAVHKVEYTEQVERTTVTYNNVGEELSKYTQVVKSITCEGLDVTDEFDYYAMYDSPQEAIEAAIGSYADDIKHKEEKIVEEHEYIQRLKKMWETYV